MTAAIPAIETEYRGYRFRSRREARWAVFLDVAGVTWEYEPEGYVLPDGVRYLPDFLITLKNGRKFWLEIKGKFPDFGEIAKCSGLADVTGLPAFLYFGDIAAPGPGLSRTVSADEFYEAAGGGYEWDNERGWSQTASFAWEWEIGLAPTAFMFRPGKGLPDDAKSGHWWWTDCPVCDSVCLKLTGQVGWCPEIPEPSGDELPPEVRYPNFGHESRRLQDAYRAARAARFEHGEAVVPAWRDKSVRITGRPMRLGGLS